MTIDTAKNYAAKIETTKGTIDVALDAKVEQVAPVEVRGRINFTDLVGSALLRKPSGNHHNGGVRPGFDTSLLPGDPGRIDYDKFVAWILRGAPEN